MHERNTYVKDIEQYFLSLSGAGVMLSPEDYDLILRWKRRGIQKDAVLKGITNAFSQLPSDAKPRRLKKIAPFIEEQIEISKILAPGDSEPEFSAEDFIRENVRALDEIIREETNKTLISHYAKVRARVFSLVDSASSDDNIFGRVRVIEDELFEDFFRQLPPSEAERVMELANAQLSAREKFMTDRARRESLLHRRNLIICAIYGLKRILTGDVENG